MFERNERSSENEDEGIEILLLELRMKSVSSPVVHFLWLKIEVKIQIGTGSSGNEGWRQQV